MQAKQIKPVQALSNMWFGCVLLIMLVLVFLRTVYELPIPVGVFLILALIPAAMGTSGQMLAFVICCIPLSAAFQFKYALLLCILFYLLKRRGKYVVSHVALAVLLLMLWELLHAFYGDFSVIEYLRDFAELMILPLLIGIDPKEFEHKLVIRSLAFCTVGVCLTLIVLQMKQAGWSLSFLTPSFRFGDGNPNLTDFGLTYNPNRLGFICNLALTGLLLLYSRKEHTRADIAMAIMLIGFGIMTLSRTFVVCLVIVILGFVVTMPGSVKRKLWGTFGIAVIGVITLLIMIRLFPQVSEALIARFFESDISNGRNDIFVFYLQHIMLSPMYFLFGVGLQNYYEKVAAIHDTVALACHNGYQEIWVVWGIVGVALMGYMIAALLIIARSYTPKQNAVQYIPIIMILISVMAGQFVSAEIPLLSLVFAYICLCIRNEGETDDHTKLSEKSV